MSLLRVEAVGDRAFAVYPDDATDDGASARVRSLDRALLARPFRGFVESVPSVRALLVLFDPDAVSFDDACGALRALPSAGGDEPDAGRLHLVPTRYGGEDGPDLDDVARACSLSPDAYVARHAAHEYRALMLGFRPGFAYLGWLPAELRTARKATPRVRVPAGSVAVAGLQTAVYPSASAGGWNLIGRAAVSLFDPARDPPVLIRPDDRVRFVPAEEPMPVVVSGDTSAATGVPSIEILDGGLLTTVQDRGRPGYRRLGVSTAGALDQGAAARANAAVGNASGDALLECTVMGPVLRFLRPLRFAVAGADLGAILERADLGSWPVPAGIAVLARAGNVLRFRGRASGCRAYVALSGGIEVPILLGSRSTDLTAAFGGLGGRALRAGDRLRAGGSTKRATADRSSGRAPAEHATLRVVLGPQADHFTPATIERFLASEWAVAATSDRAACRLTGPPLDHAGASEIPSEGMVPGCVQVPPDGQPIVMLADSPTTGGYPKIATVVSADLPLLAQLLPAAACIRFTAAPPSHRTDFPADP